jgi:hypothetical protein
LAACERETTARLRQAPEIRHRTATWSMH